MLDVLLNLLMYIVSGLLYYQTYARGIQMSGYFTFMKNGTLNMITASILMTCLKWGIIISIVGIVSATVFLLLRFKFKMEEPQIFKINILMLIFISFVFIGTCL